MSEQVKYNPTCIVTGKKDNLLMYPHRNSNGDMVGWLFIHETVDIKDIPEMEWKKPVPEKKPILKLAAHLLNEYASSLTNNGCNDTDAKINALVSEIGGAEFQKLADEWNGEFCENARYSDWIVANVVASQLKKI